MNQQDINELSTALSAWLQAHALQILIATATGLMIYTMLRALRRVVRPHRDELGADLTLPLIIRRAIGRTTHFFMAMAAARLVAGYANPPEALYLTIRTLFVISAVFQGAIWLREIVLGAVERRAAADGTNETLTNATSIIRLLVTVALFAVAAIVVLDNLGVNVTGLVAGLGIGGIAIGLAAQGIFSDLFAALSIIFDKPFHRGETIHYDTTTATVERIGLKSTRLRSITGERKVISNANLLQKEITSYRALDHRRVKFAFGITYQTDPETCAGIPAILQDIVESLGGCFVRAGFIGFGASSLDFELEMDIYQSEWDAIYATRHAIGIAVLRRFNELGIAFAYPTQTSFTAAPDGRFVLPYADVQPATDQR